MINVFTLKYDMSGLDKPTQCFQGSELYPAQHVGKLHYEATLDAKRTAYKCAKCNHRVIKANE